MKTVLFDLDDTLLDYSGGVEDSWAHAVQTCCTDGRVEPQALVAALARSRQWFWDDPVRQRQERTNMMRAWQLIVAHALESLHAPCHDLVAAIATQFSGHRRQMMRLFPDARATLERLRGRGIPLGLITNGDASQQRYKIECHDLARYFDVIIIEGEFGAGKPDEVVYRHALDTLGVHACDTQMVGDNLDLDVEGARRLGIHAVWIDRAGTGLPAGSTVKPDRIITSLSELV